MKKLLFTLILAVFILFITACNDGKYFTNKEIAEIDIDKELENIAELYDFLGRFSDSMGVDVQLPGLSELSKYTPPEEIDFGEFTLLPMEIFEHDKPGRNKFTGKLFYFNSFAEEVTYNIDDGAYFISVVVLDEETNTFDFMLVLIPAGNEDWDDECLQNYIRFLLSIWGIRMRNIYGGITGFI